MTSPELLDPQQAAFWAADPNILHEPDPLAPGPETEPEQTHRARLALEIAAAFLVCVRIARAHLASQRDVDPSKAGTQAWSGVAGTFRALTSDALVRALRLDPNTSALSPRELTTLANTYVTGLGTYLGESSVKAFVGAVDRQLADRWSQEVAYARAVAGFGLERQSLGPFLTKAAAVVDQEVVTPAAQAISDAALLVRAELIGDTEARTAVEGVKALHWRQQLANGELPATARRRWATHHLDMDCAICGALHGQEVELDKPFTVEKFEIWAPLAHPNCQCSIELVHASVAKAYNPNERRGQPGNRGQWAANPTTYATPAEQRSLLDDLEVEEEKQQPASPFAGTAKPSPFAGSPFSRASGGSPFARTAASPFAATGPSGKLVGTSGKLVGLSGKLREASDRLSAGGSGRFKSQVNRRVTRVLVPPPPMPKVHHPYYLSADAFHAEVDEHEVGTALPLYTDIDFDRAHPTSYGALHAEAVADPWQVMGYDERALGRVKFREGEPVTSLAAVSQWWFGISKLIDRGRDIAAGSAFATWPNNAGLIERLDPDDRWKIAEMAGYENYVDDDDLIGDIGVAVDSGDDPHGLAQAYADYVALQRPDLLGELGNQIIHELRTGREEYKTDIAEHSYNQVFAFTKGFHSGTRRSPRHADVRGRFVITEIAYCSPWETFGESPPPLYLGLQVADVQPMVKHKGPPLSRFGQRELE